jgi:death on curing protein
VIYLTLRELLLVGKWATGEEVVIRDVGLLESALARPPASAFGKDAYSSVEEKAASLSHSLSRSHALIDGNERLSLAATIAFLGLNGRRLTLSNGQAYELIMSVATGDVDDIATIAALIRDQTEAR